MNPLPGMNDEPAYADDGAGAGAPALPEPAKAGTPNIVPIPLAALAEPEESTDAMINPEVGDICNFQVEGKIVSINGETAMVQPSSVNGKPLDGGTEEQDEVSPEQQDAGDYGDLESQANQIDQSQ